MSKNHSKIRNSKRKAILKTQLVERDGTCCHYCKREMIIQCLPEWNGALPDGAATLDHKVSLGEGGTHELDNLVLACYRCNFVKDSIPYEVFKQYYRAVPEYLLVK